MPNVWDPLTVSWTPPRGVGCFSGSALCTHSLSGKLTLALLHRCCCSGWPSRGAGISTSAGIVCCNRATPSPKASLVLYSGGSTPAPQRQAWAAHHDSFMPSKSVPPDFGSGTTKFSCQPARRRMPLKQHSLCVWTPRKHLPEDFTPTTLASLSTTNFSAPADRHQGSQ